VQKLRAGEQFLARGKVHGSLTAASSAVGNGSLLWQSKEANKSQRPCQNLGFMIFEKRAVPIAKTILQY
jgi:hypothetical protein